MTTIDNNGNLHDAADGRFASKPRTAASGALDDEPAAPDAAAAQAAGNFVGPTQDAARSAQIRLDAIAIAHLLRERVPDAAALRVYDDGEVEERWHTDRIVAMDANGDPVPLGEHYDAIYDDVMMRLNYLWAEDVYADEVWTARDDDRQAIIELDATAVAGRDIRAERAAAQRAIASQLDPEVLRLVLAQATPEPSA